MMPIRDMVIFPYMMTPFVVGRESSVRALEEALSGDRKIFLATQHDASSTNPKPTISTRSAPSATSFRASKCLTATSRSWSRESSAAKIAAGHRHRRLLCRHRSHRPHHRLETDAADRTVDAARHFPVRAVREAQQSLNYETMIAAVRMDEPAQAGRHDRRQPAALASKRSRNCSTIFDPAERLARIADVLDVEIEKLNMDRTIQSRVKRQMERAQKEYYLNEKIKAIQKELGRGEKSEFDELKKKIEAAGMPKDVYDKAMQELKKLEAMPPMSAESTVSRNYLDWLLAVPWKKRSKEIRNIDHAEKVLNEDHYGLEKIKERILEFLAVRQLVKNPKGSILCFVGPPGVGKTSLGMSIAKATGRKFVRMSLGGVRDEAEIRGHRRTYIGALPGQIIQLDEEGRHQESGLHAGRSRQDGVGLPRRSGFGAA